METEVSKPESALGFLPSHMKAPEDGDIMKQRLKNLQNREEQRIKAAAEEYAKNTARTRELLGQNQRTARK